MREKEVFCIYIFKGEKKMDDIPKGIILVLLIITVLISVLGTWTVMDQLSEVRVKYVPQGKTVDGAEISLRVETPHEQVPEPPKEVDTSAELSITILEPRKGGK
ncbi:hypothetical protein DRJ48_01950 [Candidatus Woesearchaeota archaeon]|nr:MAG: hypothetical protein DRJ48_01950 [Candidatus Woesearchaeota archaeon]